MSEHPTVAQNKAHKADTEWIKSPGKSFQIEFSHKGAKRSHTFVSEYVSTVTGWAIRKDWRMTGRDWHVFNAEGEVIAQAHSLTFAKIAARHHSKGES